MEENEISQAIEELVVEKKNIKTVFYTKKVFIIPVSIILFMALVYAVSTIVATIPTTISVNEPLSSSTTSLSFSGYPGSSSSQTINVQNSGVISYNVSVDWVETSNSGITYSTNLPKTVEVAPGSNSIMIDFSVATGSGIGSASGNVTVSRL